MANAYCRFIGAVLLLIGVAGFAAPNLLGFHLTPMHNIVHILSGAAALFAGFGSFAAARGYCIVFGLVYLGLGILGYLAPDFVSTVLGHPPLSASELTPDNLLHLGLGVITLVVGLAAVPRAVRVTHH